MGIYQVGKCKECFNIGYRGRVGISEIMVMSPKIRELILERAQEVQIKQVSLEEDRQTLRADGVSKVLKGITTLEEVLKVTMPD